MTIRKKPSISFCQIDLLKNIRRGKLEKQQKAHLNVFTFFRNCTYYVSMCCVILITMNTTLSFVSSQMQLELSCLLVWREQVQEWFLLSRMASDSLSKLIYMYWLDNLTLTNLVSS